MLPIVWRASARDDLQSIVRYIANESPAAARRMKGLFSLQPLARRALSPILSSATFNGPLEEAAP